VRTRALRTQPRLGQAEPTAAGVPNPLIVCVPARELPCVVEVGVVFVTTLMSLARRGPYTVVTNESGRCCWLRCSSPGWAMSGLDARATVPAVSCCDGVSAVGRLEPTG
jgi:hypothetical protein